MRHMVEFYTVTCSGNTIKCPAGGGLVHNIEEVVHRYDLLSYLVKKIEVWERDFSHTARRSGSSGAIFYTVTSGFRSV